MIEPGLALIIEPGQAPSGERCRGAPPTRHRSFLACAICAFAVPVASPYLLFIDARRCGRIVAVIAPRRVIEVNDKIGIVGGDRFVEHQSPNTRPIAKPAPLKERSAVR